jgi:asparagine synthase (glutamine-hydrolysing)
MCGITGVYNLNKQSVDIDILDRMTDTLSHRGQDDRGTYADKNLGLGHRRLKIIDLTPQARQPMSNEDGKILLVYNGEIYNYIELREELVSLGHLFKSRSDSEVVIHAYEQWGEECLERFVGMWAFAVWDARTNTLFASRDRLGIKPFYYFFNGSDFIFASETKAILQRPEIKRRADMQAIYEYLYLGYSLGDKTWIEGIRKLKPGHYLILKSGGLQIRQYWQARANPDYLLSEEKASAALNGLINESVRLMLRADVEVGVHLSGGVDSSSITAVASRLSSQKIKTFSGAFEEEGCEFDESRYIKEVVDKYADVNEKINIKPDDFIANVKRIVWHMDEPSAGCGAYPQFFVSKLLHSRGIKVVLGGQGGDELFGGYPHYYSGIFDSLRRLKTSCNYNDAHRKYYRPGDFYLRFLPAYVRRELGRRLSLRRGRLNRTLDRDILKKIDFNGLEDQIGFYKGSLEDMQLWDINNYLPALLQVEDRLGMAFSVETRLPFLNHKMVEYALGVPFYLKLNSFNFKYILRIAMKDELPKSVFDRTDKKGFPTPIKVWLKDKDLRDAVSRENEANLPKIFVNRQPSWERLNIGLWFKTFKVSI